jgi:ATP-dependent helicase IRC3
MCRYRRDGYARMPSFIKGLWDGWDPLYRNRRFPIGFLEDIEMLCFLNDVNPIRKDYRRVLERNPIEPSAEIQPRPYQGIIINDALSRGYGRIQAPTGAGKTLIFTWMLCKLGVPSLVVVPTNDILRQTLDQFDKVAGVVGVHADTTWLMETEKLPAGEDNWCVATWQAINYVLNQLKKPKDETRAEEDVRLALRRQVRALLASFGAVIVDEAHCAGAKAVYKVLSNLPARWRYGTSATPFRPSGDEKRLHGALGPVLSGITPSELIDLGYLVQPDIEFYVMPRPMEPLSRTDDYPTVVREGIVHHMARNHWLAEKAFEMHALEDRTVLVMVTQILHGNIMQNLIRGYFKDPGDVVFVHGSLRPKRRKQISDDFRSGKIPIAISSSVWNEGVDFPLINGIVIASPNKSSNMSKQRLGRGLRPDPASGKRDCRVIETFNELPFIAHHDKLREADYRTEKRFNVQRMGRANLEDILERLQREEEEE